MIKDKIAEGVRFHMEVFDSASDVVKASAGRQIRDRRFDNMALVRDDPWYGCGSLTEALGLLRNGYEVVVDRMSTAFKAKMAGETKRIRFTTAPAGFAPVVPLALMGVPNSMLSMQMAPMKAKVLDVYYDITAPNSRKPEEFIAAGRELLSSVVALERQGYRVNLYVTQSYYDNGSADMLIVKVKSADRLLDIKRCAFPVVHPSFLRLIGFDWYSKVPGGRYRAGYGRSLYIAFGANGFRDIGRELFGRNALYVSCVSVMDNGKGYIEKEVNNGR